MSDKERFGLPGEDGFYPDDEPPVDEYDPTHQDDICNTGGAVIIKGESRTTNEKITFLNGKTLNFKVKKNTYQKVGFGINGLLKAVPAESYQKKGDLPVINRKDVTFDKLNEIEEETQGILARSHKRSTKKDENLP